jgi:HEAT repeat protein
MLEQAFDALKTYDWGVDRNVLNPIDEAVVKTRNDPAARKQIESRLLAVLQSNAPRDAKDYVCRQLRTMGTAASVPVLEQVLADAELSHMARYALERIPEPQAGQALERQLRKLSGNLKIGDICSLGSRGPAAAATSVALLRPLLKDPDDAVARAAATALGRIASLEADKALASAKPRAALVAVFADASMSCAVKLLAASHAREAKATYKRLLKNRPSELIRQAAERRLKDCQRG